MQKIIAIPDSFKGTMESSEICAIMEREIHRHFPAARIVSIPVADGGEGSVDCFLAAMGGDKVWAEVQGPFGAPMPAFYGLLEGGRTAVVEMAACAGLPLAGDRKNPLTATTYGVGQLILAAAGNGAKKIIVGLGGSATNDGGCGAAAACGVRFLDASDTPFVPTGGTLADICRIETQGLDPALQGVEVVTMCDIDNPMFGPCGAARVFAPQKGADTEMVERLDDGVRHLAEVIHRDLGREIARMPGTGAAGAMGAGMVAFFGSRLQMGIETVLDAVHFDDLLPGADLVLTGEGKIDGQSLRGKVVIGVAGRAARQGVPVVAVVGDIGDDAPQAYERGVTAILSINRVAVDFSVAKSRARSDLALTVDNLMRLCRARIGCGKEGPPREDNK